ncbi:MAG: FtsX-like permease family protein [Acidobacteria bacterium]|nr:FtsX-like permease family protein [Acidobacteriota bacterium]
MVRNVKSSSLEAAPRPQVYRPFLQNTQNEMTILIRAEGDPLKLVAAARAEIGAVDPNQPIDNVRTMEQVVSQSVARRRFQMLLLGLFATVALVLTMVGLYGVISYSVSQRTHEIGIRMALGAQQGDVLRMVVGQGLRLAMFGLGAGLAAALLLTRVLSSMLYGVSPTDPATFAGVSFLLAVVALAASYFPARRATKVDPMVALRHE